MSRRVRLFRSRSARLCGISTLCLRPNRALSSARHGTWLAAFAGFGLTVRLLPMARSVIVSTARTPFGKLGGGLAAYKAPELGAIAIKAALERAGLSPARSST